MGPVYGFQWRHFGADYGTCEDDYSGKGVDQLMRVIETIKNNPTDRRIVLSAWNPKGQSVPLSIYKYLHTDFYRSTINGPATLSHVLSILRHTTRNTRIKTPTLMSNVSTIMRFRIRCTL